jgi:predicted PurR-regulated permease PerM
MSPGTSKLEWQRAVTTLSGVAVFAAVVAALYWAKPIFIPVALAVFLTFVMSPVVAWLQRRGLGRLPAVLGTVGLGVLAAALTGGLVAWQLGSLSQTLPDHAPKIKAKLAEARHWLVGEGESRFGKMLDDIASVFSSPAAPKEPRPGVQVVHVEPQGSTLSAQVQEYLSPALEVVGQTAFAFVLSVFMLMKKEDLRNRLIRLTGDTQVTTATKAVEDASRRVSRYLFMQLMINSTFGVVITLVMLLIGVKYALLWGFLASVMRYVPYLGTWIGLIPPVVFSLATSDGWWQPLTVIAVYGGLELTCNNVFEPWLYGSSMGLSEVAQLVAAAFWTFLWGPIGLILSGPLTVCLLVLGKYVPRFGFLEVLLGDEPALAPDVRLYQRLAARDQDEASEVAHDALKHGSAEGVFDTVMVPALSYAKRDHERRGLTDEDLRAIVGSMREIADDVIDGRLIPAGGSGGDEPNQPKIRVLVVPAWDETEEVPLEMLRGLLDPAKWEVEVTPAERMISEVVARIGQVKPAVVVVGSLPPGGLTHCRYVCKRIAKQFPDLRLVVGRWGLAGDAEGNRDQLTGVGAAFVATSLADMVTHLTNWRSALKAQQKAAEKGTTKTVPAGAVGTVSA